jgi:short-subunit dehydrogenase
MRRAAVDVLRDYGLAVVTGGTSGIGKSFIATIAEASPATRLCNLSRGECALPGIENFSCDFADPSARRAVFPRVAEWAASRAEAGRLLLINNSGFGTYHAFPEPKTREHVEMIEVNVAALVELTGCLLPELRRRGGAVINVASTAAFQPTPWLQTYAATKSFVLNWSVALARELRHEPAGVRVQALCPGPTRTNFHQRAGFAGHAVSDRFAQQPHEVVATSLRALRGRRERVVVVSGRINAALAAISRIAPLPVAAIVAGWLVGRYRCKPRAS